MNDILKADPRARRWAIALVVAAAAGGSVLIYLAQSAQSTLVGWVTNDVRALPARLRIATAVVTILSTGMIVAYAAYLWHHGRRIILAERCPPPGAIVIKDTVVETGDAARRRGRTLQMLALLLVVASLLIAATLWTLTEYVARMAR